MPPTPSLVSDCASSASPSRVGPLPTSFLHDEPEFQFRVARWASTLRTVEEDEFVILPALPTLAFAFNRILKASNNRSKEHAQRRAIDDIIELAFSARRDRHCNFGTEEGYRLVGSPGNPDAVSDTLVTIPSVTIADKIGVTRLSFQTPSTAEHLYWSTGGSMDGFSIIGFPGEFKADENHSNKNQVIMALVTAQAQRKALELKHSIIMGAIASRGHVQILSSYRKSENSFVYIHAHKQLFDLSDPSQLIRLYVFFSKLERDFQGTIASELLTTVENVVGQMAVIRATVMVVLWMRMDSMVVLKVRMDSMVTSTWTL
ncbi:uncharacterized protein LACBIDRAFT_307258 [Laccaria bicolor S238N-H82]|uniref:Predicted protein n=1 Tax=Laccaria bicolor (strain S238N-H82 / ATCC MYA-4686) TaxID=486041 RepID=B0DPR8_LACBS|nr:uncharacterized protein LACBIDRAFT_307258 [Laccaria bicolor S238N-H82]EDR03500.1 predicted protein [Laccaria bicolor S238N-H82]|eukprot:XP_001885956.1 predicted protein [Laccaria bicolor S238N-H82]